MKKSLLVFVCACALALLTGCVKNQVTCTGEQNQEGIKIRATVTAELDSNDKLTDAVIEYELDNNDAATQYCNIFKTLENTGKGVNVKCSGKKITVTGYANIETEDESESYVGASKEDFIKAMENEGLTCK